MSRTRSDRARGDDVSWRRSWGSPAMLGAVVLLLGAVAIAGPGQQNSATPIATPTAVPTTTDDEQPAEDPRDILDHPLIGATRSQLDARLGAPERQYRGARYAFLEYDHGSDRFQIVLDADTVIEVSRIR